MTLEGTENRITVARNRYIQTVQEYNVLARSFPTNLTAKIFGYAPKPNFTRAERGADLDAAGGRLQQAGPRSTTAGRWPTCRASPPAGPRMRRTLRCWRAWRCWPALLGVAWPARGPGPAAGAPLSARVIDQTGTLDAAQRQALEAKLAGFEQRKGARSSC